MPIRSVHVLALVLSLAAVGLVTAASVRLVGVSAGGGLPPSAIAVATLCLCFALGAAAGVMPGRRPERRGVLAFFLAALGAGAAPLLVDAGAAAAVPFTWRLGAVLAATIIGGPAMLGAGLGATAAARLIGAGPPVLAAAALGLAGGAVVAVFGTLPWGGPTASLHVAAAVFAALALALAAGDPMRPIVLGGVAVGAGLLYWLGAGQDSVVRLPCTAETARGCLEVRDISSRAGGEAAQLVDEGATRDATVRDAPTRLLDRHAHFVDEIVQRRGAVAPGVTPAAFIGGSGAVALTRAWMADFEAVDVVAAMAEPAAARLARDALWLPDTLDGLWIVHEEARPALRRVAEPGRFDVVALGTLPHGVEALRPLVSREFAVLVAGTLGADGLYVLSVVDNTSQPRFLFALVQTLASVFPAVEVWLDRDALHRAGTMPYHIVAAAGHTESLSLRARRGPDRTWVRWPGNDLARRLSAAESPVLTDRHAPLEDLLPTGGASPAAGD